MPARPRNPGIATMAEVERFLGNMRRNPIPAWAKAFKIVPKEGGLCVFRPNTVQKRLHAALTKQRDSGKPQRAIVYKARQTGISTYMEARLTSMALTEPHSQSLIVAHVEVAVEGLHEKVKLTLENLPLEIRPVMPNPRFDKIVLHGIPCRDGRIALNSLIATAKATGKPRWRSMTLRAVHLSELAFYNDGGTVLDGILQAVPSDPGSLVVIESTAYGATGTFYDEWNRAKEGGSDFAPIFVPWYEMEEYRHRPERGFVRTKEEARIVKLYDVDDDQLQWRRWCIKNNCRGDEDKFKQEYPATEEDGFWLTGRPAFPADKLRAMLSVALQHTPRLQGWFDLSTRKPFAGEGGPYQEWKAPVDGHDYVIAGDAAAGTKDGDFAAIIVFDRMDNLVVATWHGKCTPTELGFLLNAIGRYYHDAVMAPEVNNHGLGVIEVLKNEFYPRWYFWQRVDKASNNISRFLGWETSFRTRPLMVDTMRHAIVNRAITILDPAVIRELLEFEYLVDDDLHPVGRLHDDRAMAMMIAYRVHVESPMLDTGLPPNVHVPTDETPDTAPKFTNSTVAMHSEIWDEADAQLKQAQVQQNQGAEWHTWDMPDKDDLPLEGIEMPEMPY